MKILVEGPGESWTKTIRCSVLKDTNGFTWDGDKPHCGSLLEINEEDVYAKHWDKYFYGLSGIDYLVTCPKCGCRLYLDPNDIPEWVKNCARIKKQDEDTDSEE